MTTAVSKIATLGNIEKRLFNMFLVVAVLLLGSYLYLVNESVFNIVARKQAEEKIGQLGTSVAILEAEYLALAGQEITPSFARSLGFRDVSAEQAYAVSTNQTVTLSLVSNEL